MKGRRLAHLNRTRKVRQQFVPQWDVELGRLIVMGIRGPTMFDGIAAQRRCLYSVPWLALKVRHNRVGWKGIQNVRDNLTILGRYLGDHWDDQTRLWQVMDLF